MKKASVAEDNNANVQGKEGSRLNRSSMQLANRLDIQLRSVVEWQELFHPDAILLRQRLRNQCENLILNHPKEYGRRAEERLWRKVFYDVIQKLRNHRKIMEADTQSLDGVLRTHLSSAAGYYYHLLTHLQLTYKLNVDGVLSWGFPSTQQEDKDDEIGSWAIKACQRCLIFLGDIARYQSDLEGKEAIKLAERFYFEAALINPDIGMPQNQLGTLAGTKAYGCEGAYFYLRCLLSKEVFEGAEGNLLRIFEKNRSILHRIKELPLDEPRPKERLKRFLVYFLYLQDVLYQHEKSPEISSEDTGHLCQSVLQDFSSVLSVDPASSNTRQPSLENGVVSEENGGLEYDVTDDQDGVISSSLMVKLVVMAIVTVTRLQSKGSQDSSVATAFTLAFLSLLLQNCISSFENFLTKEHSNTEHLVVNGPTNTALSHNGFSKHENSFQGRKVESNLNQAKQLKKVMKHRRRRRRRRKIDYSFESYSGSGSDLEESGDDEEGEDSDLSSNSTFNVALLVLVSLFLCGLALSNGLDPGAVDPDEVQYLKEWRTSPKVKVTLPRDPTEDEIFVVETSDEEEKEPYRWCRSCNLWRPPGVSHCSECRKCFWRMDHHCWLIGNCVAMRNHRFFTLMVVCGCLAWTSVLVKTLWDFFLEETHRNFLEFEWFDIIAVLFIVWSLLGLAFLVPFSLFHVSALLCNITSKNACGHRRISWTSRRMNGFEEYDQIFCGPLQMRPCQEHRSIHMQPRETTNG